MRFVNTGRDRQWKMNRKGRSSALLAVDIDASAMVLNDLAGAVKSNAGAADPSDNVASAAKPLEHVRQVARGNPDALIGNAQACLRSPARFVYVN